MENSNFQLENSNVLLENSSLRLENSNNSIGIPMEMRKFAVVKAKDY
jgi:hypothetical protein